MKTSDTRSRMIALLFILNGNGKLTLKEIRNRLDLLYGIRCDCKTLYQDLYSVEIFHPNFRVLREGGTVYYQLMKENKE